MTYIYALKLRGDNYYVGKTDNPQFRLETHFDKGGAVFTKRFKPTHVHALHPDCTDHDETRITLDYMREFGIQKVRGGPWTQIMLTDAEEEFIQKMIDSESDNCYRCGKSGHYVGKCPDNKKSKSKKKKIETCGRCQRYGHSEKTCYANTTANGTMINNPGIKQDTWLCEFCDSEFDTKKGCKYHENYHCSKRRNRGKMDHRKASQDLWDEVNDSSSDDPSDESIHYFKGKSTYRRAKASKAKASRAKAICERCGISGHYATTCHVRL